jgi:hypothetical protein
VRVERLEVRVQVLPTVFGVAEVVEALAVPVVLVAVDDADARPLGEEPAREDEPMLRARPRKSRNRSPSPVWSNAMVTSPRYPVASRSRSMARS